MQVVEDAKDVEVFYIDKSLQDMGFKEESALPFLKCLLATRAGSLEANYWFNEFLSTLNQGVDRYTLLNSMDNNVINYHWVKDFDDTIYVGGVLFAFKR